MRMDRRHGGARICLVLGEVKYRPDRWQRRVGLVGGDGASGRVREYGVVGGAVGVDVVVVEVFVVAGAEQDEVVELRPAAVLAGVMWWASSSRVAVQPGYWQWPSDRL